jgi:hypothetical protein
MRAMAVALMLCVLSLASTAAAQAAASSPPAPTDAEAHALFTAGQLAFQSGRFETALGHFTRAYELSHRAELLFNIGQCQDFLRHDADALTAFEGYLAAVPDAPTRAVVEARVVALRAAVAASAPAAPPSTDEAVVSPPVETSAPAPSPALAHLTAHGPEGFSLFRRQDAPGSSTGTDDQLVCALPCEIDVPAEPVRFVVDRGHGDSERHALDHGHFELSGRVRLTVAHVDRSDQRLAGALALGIGIGLGALMEAIAWGSASQADHNDPNRWWYPVAGISGAVIGLSLVVGLVLACLGDTYDDAVVRF